MHSCRRLRTIVPQDNGSLSRVSRRRQFAAGCVGVLTGLLLVLSMAEAAVCAEDKRDYSRWEKEIAAIEQKIADGRSVPGRPLFVGSSSIRLWDLDQAFPGLKAANHGFGGSQLCDSVHFFDRIVTPLKPSAIVLYAGDNDIAAGKKAAEVFADFQAFVAKTRETLPSSVPVLYIAVKPSIKRWALREEMIKANAMIADECRRQPGLIFVDVWPPMLNDQGMPQEGLFLKDGLHLNADGYQIWQTLLKEHLMGK